MVAKIVSSDGKFWITGGLIFFVSYILCIVTDIMGFSNFAFVKSSWFRSVLSVLHGLDGVAALLIGLAIMYRSEAMLILALIMMTKFYLIHLLNRMILANKKTDNFYDGVTQTTKSFLHHVASFLFLQSSNEIIITTAWRTISMSGHAALVLRDKLSHEAMHHCHWGLAYVRIFFLVLLLYVCYSYPSLRSEFAQSAVGHIAYMAVRIEPVFKQGGIYLTADEKVEWALLSNAEKVAQLGKGAHPWLALELVLLAAVIVLFAVLRLELLIVGSTDVNMTAGQGQGQGEVDFLGWFTGTA